MKRVKKSLKKGRKLKKRKKKERKDGQEMVREEGLKERK